MKRVNPMVANHRLIYCSLLALLGYGCSATPGKQASPDPRLVECTDPRPQACTMHYDPVCGNLEDGGRQTYSNGCTACADQQVLGHRPGECP